MMEILLVLLSFTNKIESGGLFASHHRYPGYVQEIWGVHGQDCTPDTGDFPTACPTLGQLKTDTHGIIGCSHNFDCCTCGTMLCGPDCAEIVCNGDSGCYGVKDIHIIGGELGATLNCNGDLSCMWTHVWGTNIGGILCTGDGACAYSIFDMVCVGGAEPCTLLCVGDDSCRSDPDGDLQKQASFTIANSFGMKCAHDACVDATFNLMQNLGGSIHCSAEEACVRAEISINNIEFLGCRGIMACKSAHIFIKNPEEGFSVLCSGVSSCEDLELEIMITDPEIAHFRGISCMSASACKGMHVTINKIGGSELAIEELMCGAAEACRNVVFDIGPNIIFEQCQCAPALTLACDNLLGVDMCMADMNVLECKGANACKGKIETITNPGNGFEIYCPDAGSCQDMQLTVVMDGGRRGVTTFGGIYCGSENACKGLIFNIYNVVVGFRIDAGIVTCDAPNACTNAKFNLIGADIAVSCVNNACVGCESTVLGLCRECGTNQNCLIV